MSRTFFGRTLTLLSVLALLLFTTVAYADQSVPFSTSTVFTLVGTHGNVLIYEGTSSVTHLGLCDQVVDVTIKTSAKGASAEGSVLFTDPSGDELYMTFQQAGNEVLQAFVGTYTITGGTGRFENASGTGSIISAPQPDGTILTSCKGTIAY